MHRALFLVLAFFNSAVIWLLMEAEFLAIVLMLVYVGAVMVLFLFVVMMLDVNIAEMREGFTRHAPLGALIAAGRRGDRQRRVGAEPRRRAPEAAAEPAVEGSAIPRARRAALHEVPVSVRAGGRDLLIAIVAAIALTMRQRAGLKAQDIAGQVAVAPRTASASSRCPRRPST